MSGITNIHNKLQISYEPTEEDIKELEDAFGKPESLTQSAVRSFFMGAATQLGGCTGMGIHAAFAGENVANAVSMHNRDVILCKSTGYKIHRSDLERMQQQIHATEQQLATAEQTVKQAEEVYNAAWAKAVDHLVPSIECNGHANIAFQNPGSYITYDGPALNAAKAVRDKAYSDYNYTLCKSAQEKAAYGHVQRAYEKQNQTDMNGVSVGWEDAVIGFFTGLFGVSISKNF